MHRIQSKQQGQGLSEYLVIVGLIAVASIRGWILGRNREIAGCSCR